MYLIQFNAYTQSDWDTFKKQPFPLKIWAITHPFKVKKAYKISLEAQKVSDSISNSNLFERSISEGKNDAFRHAYWMALLNQKIGKNAAISLGKAYERANKRTFRKRKLEEGILPDKASKKMDLYNNKKGVLYTQKKVTISKKALVYKVINAVYKGDLKMIKRDSLGNYLTCKGEIIPLQKLKHTWKNNKCLVLTNSK